MIALTQPKVPGARIRGCQKGFQWVILGLERVPGVLKGVRGGPMGPPGPLELAHHAGALGKHCTGLAQIVAAESTASAHSRDSQSKHGAKSGE